MHLAHVCALSCSSRCSPSAGVAYAVRKRVLGRRSRTSRRRSSVPRSSRRQARRGSTRKRSRPPPPPSSSPRCSAVRGSSRVWGRCLPSQPPVRVALGVLWSNALAYHGVTLAPHDQLAELEAIGKRFARPGAGADDRVSAVRRTPLPPPPRRGRSVRAPPQARAEDGRIRRAEGRDPRSGRARAPGRARLPHARVAALAGRQPPARAVRAALAGPLVRGLAARDHGRRPSPRTFRSATRPIREPPPIVPACSPSPAARERLRRCLARTRSPCCPRGRRACRRRSSSTAPGRYSLWLAGSRREGADVYIDGRRLESAPAHFDSARGSTRISVPPCWRPACTRSGCSSTRASSSSGTGAPDYGFGPLVVAAANQRRNVTTLDAQAAPLLCGRTLDWVEAIR